MALKRLGAACAVFVLFLVGFAGPAGAHASLQSSDPAADSIVKAPPARVVLRFDEAVDPALGGVRVTGPDGRRVDVGHSRTENGGRTVTTDIDAARRGSYLVEWSVLSEDSHLLRSSYVFSIGSVSTVATGGDATHAGLRLLGGVARVVAYAGTALLIGVVVVGRRHRRGAAAAVVGSVAAATAATVLLLTQTALAAGRSLPDAVGLLEESLATRSGLLTGLRVGLGLLALAASLTWRRWASCSWLTVLPTAGLVVVPAISGHAWTTSPTALAVSVDAVHLASVGTWIGGLAITSIRDDRTLRSRLIAFSPIAAAAMAATIGSGVASGWLQSRSFDAVTSTGYGRLLLLKAALVALVVGAGWLTRRTLQSERSRRHLLVAGEMGVAIAVFAVTAVLVNQPPARDVVARPITVEAQTTGDITGTVLVQLSPGRRGPNDLHVYLFDDLGRPRRVDAVEVRAARPGQPDRALDVLPVTPEHVSVLGAVFPASGTWELTITSLAAGRASTGTVEVSIR